MTIFLRVLNRRAFAAIACLTFCVTASAWAQEEAKLEPPPMVVTKLQIFGPEVLNEGVNLVGVKAQYNGKKNWRIAKPEEFTLSVTGDAGHVVPDVSGQSVNPVTISTQSLEKQGLERPGTPRRLTVRATAGDVSVQKRFSIQKLTAKQNVTVNVAADQAQHIYTGMGAGLMFYDNQFTINKQLFDWCFKDVDTQILHVLIRPDFEPVNDNDDWQVLDNDAFQWDACQRMFWICWHARQRNPDLKVYACLYSPPPWMKANNATTGEAGLKEGAQYKLEVAEYVYAFLKHAAWKGTKIDYLCLFNEPDFPHQQDGTFYPTLRELAQAQAFISSKVNQLIDADPDFHHKPQYIFPEVLGPGSLTRKKGQTESFSKFAEGGQLDHLHAWGVHDYWKTGGDYWDVRYEELRSLPGVGDRPIWMTEWAQRFKRGDLASSMEYGENILNALRSGASAWMAFEWAHPAPNQAGLISTHWGEGVAKKRFWRSKSYYVFKQIANTSPAGGNIIPIEMKVEDKTDGRPIERLAIAKAGTLVVHLANPNNRPSNFEIKFAGAAALELKRARLTDPTHDDVEVDTQAAKGILPPYSLSTLIFEREPAKE